MKKTAVILLFGLCACSYEYIIESDGSVAASGSTTTSTGVGGADPGPSSSATGPGGAGGNTVGAGGLGGSGGEGGGPATCASAKECPQPASPCQMATCEDDGTGQLTCGVADREDGLAIDDPIEGDCVQNGCQGGEVVEDLPAEDPPDSTACSSYTCAAGQIVADPVDEGTPCGDDPLACDGAGSCVGCTTADECPQPGTCRVATCDVTGVCGEEASPDGPFDGLATNDCKRRDCIAGVLTTVADGADVPASDGLPCTIDECSGSTPVHTPRSAGSTAVGCSGVCQAGNFAGQCGLSLYSRSFPAAGGWTRQALSSVWTGANAPPPTDILVAEETSSGSHLLVIRADGTYYELKGGAWQAPRAATTVFANLPSTQVSALVSGRFFGDEILIFTTSESPPRAVSYELAGGVEPFVHADGPSLIANEQLTKSNAPPQHDTTTTWAIGEQRGVYGETEDAHVSWKSLQAIVYENWAGTDPGFYYPNAPVGEATSPFGLNGANGAPAAGTIAAAFYRNATNTAFFIAP